MNRRRFRRVLLLCYVLGLVLLPACDASVTLVGPTIPQEAAQALALAVAVL